MTTNVLKAVMLGATIAPLIFWGDNANAMSQQIEAPAVSVTAKPSPKPPKRKPPATTGRAKREGLRLKGTTTNQATRLGDAPPPKAKRASPAKAPGKATPPKERRVTVGPDRDFRLNIGLCGLTQDDGTTPGPTRCLPFTPDRPQQIEQRPTATRIPRPADVTWLQILTRYRDVLFPKLGVKIQPAGRTLVNLDTIVYTDQGKVTVQTVDLLGFPVVVEATPMTYTWTFGDGATLTTRSPGKPYPAKEITHKYLKRGDVSVSVTTHYAARFNVAGTGWQYVDDLVPVAGPATPLEVREAVPVLVEPGG
jgi:hypothetical protein